jgi:hypothetical protein
MIVRSLCIGLGHRRRRDVHYQWSRWEEAQHKCHLVVDNPSLRRHSQTLAAHLWNGGKALSQVMVQLWLVQTVNRSLQPMPSSSSGRLGTLLLIAAHPCASQLRGRRVIGGCRSAKLEGFRPTQAEARFSLARVVLIAAGGHLDPNFAHGQLHLLDLRGLRLITA